MPTTAEVEGRSVFDVVREAIAALVEAPLRPALPPVPDHPRIARCGVQRVQRDLVDVQCYLPRGSPAEDRKRS